MWILTREINEYDQDGAYFEAAFENKPDLYELSNYFYPANDFKRLNKEQLTFLIHVLNNGGRREFEHTWYNLFEYQPK